jgi:uncharacterized protein YndB with AHSA1/START domain
MTEATLIPGDPRPSVRLERRLPDPPEVVWQALTEREQLRAWFPSDVIGEWRVGAPLRFPFPPEVIDMTLSGEVLEVDPPRRLAFTWSWRHSWPDQPESLVTVELADAPGGATEVVVTHSRFGTDEAAYRGGWESGLDKLARRFAGAAVGGGEEACPWPSTR